jgi:putative DNA primase/helicase
VTVTPTQLILSKLSGVTSIGKGWSAICPAHDDHRASLSVAEGDEGRALVKCHAGCAPSAVLEAVGLTMADLMPPADAVKAVDKQNGKPRIVATYEYRDERGTALFQVVRFDPKDFRQRRSDGKGGWIWNVKGVRVIPYRLPELLAEPTSCAFVAEGEKDCDNLARLGVLATCNAGGAGKWTREHSQHLHGRSVVVLCDNDEAGRKHGRQIAQSLQGIASSVRFVELPGLPPKGDVSNWVEAGGTREDLVRLAEAAPDWTPGAMLEPGPILICLADVEPRAVEWLWQERIPLGRITLLVGRPGEGKSFLTIDAAARVTTGTPWPDGSTCPQGSVILISAEDDPADTIRPRLDAHYADVSKVHLLSAVRKVDNEGHYERLISLADVEAIEAALIMLPDCKLIVVDPVGSFLGGGTDAHRDNEVRGVLAPIAALAEKYGPAVLVVAHRRKSSANIADDLALGSRAFTGVARAVWHLSRHPEKKALRLFLPGKNNLAREGGGLAFSIIGEPPRISWEREPVALSADDALAAEAEKRDPNPGPEAAALEAAEMWLQSALAGGPRLSIELLDEWKNGQGGSDRTLKRANKELGVEAYRVKIPGPWWWRLPSKDAEPAKDVEPGPLGILAKTAGNSRFLESNDSKDARLCELGILDDDTPQPGGDSRGSMNAGQLLANVDCLPLVRTGRHDSQQCDDSARSPSTPDHLDGDLAGPTEIYRLKEVQTEVDEQLDDKATESEQSLLARDDPSAVYCPPITFEVWNDQRLHSRGDLPLAIDVETEWIKDERTVPRIAIASATDGTQHVIIHPDQLGEFLEVHRAEYFVCHNAQFDFWVIDEHLRQSAHPAQRVLWEACNEGRLRDSMILDMLIQLATGKYRKSRGAKQDAKVYPGTLAEVAADYTGVRINKEDPYRLRFGELVGLSAHAFRGVDPGFFQYAIKDVVATHKLYPALTQTARSLMVEQGYSESASRFEIRPDAAERFGHLSEIVQVKVNIALSHMYRRGVHTNQQGVAELTDSHRKRIGELTDEIRNRFPDVLTYDKSGDVKTTPKSKAPTFCQIKLAAMLQRVAEETREAGNSVDIPQRKGKKPGISLSVKEWQSYAHLHPFLRIWTELMRLGKLLGFLDKLNAAVLHCKYSPLTRTGRTACSEPRGASLPGVNLQQIPKQPEFRRLFGPRAPGNQLFIGDYSAIELRTLAAVCRAKFGYSKLADVIEQGLDPHAFTAAAIQGISLDEFLTFKRTDPERFRRERQSAKAINFGVPGGLGSKALRVYAEANYGVSFGEEEAEAFRATLISDVYPELNDRDGYLADHGMSALARNLGLPEAVVWKTLNPSGTRNTIAARGVSNVIQGRSKASPDYQARVWTTMEQLVRAAPNVDVRVIEAIRAKHGSPELHDRLYHQKVATLTGRIRDGVGFTESKNTPFQSLAADGAKLALWNLLYEGFDVYGFIHDEIIVDLSSDRAAQDAPRIKEIMEDSMEEVLGGTPAACSWILSDCWAKPD